MKSTFFENNRMAFCEKLKGGIAVLSAHRRLQRIGDEAFRFSQEANFWYLTGIEEPDWLVIIDASNGESYLVKPERNEYQEVFEENIKYEDATRISAITKVISQNEAESLLQQLSKKHPMVHTIQPFEHSKLFGFSPNPANKDLKERLERIFAHTQDCKAVLAKLRALKQPEEVQKIKKAIELSISGYKKVHEHIQNYHYEYEIEAELTYEFRRKGATSHAFEPVVASGANTCTLHYTSNNAKLQKNSFVLIDAATKYGGYSADLARTFAIGEPSQRMKDIHLATREALAEVIAIIKPGTSIKEFQVSSEKIMRVKAKNLGLIKNVADEAFRDYFPHAIGHGLGINAHDTLAYETLQSGMILAIEPGFYINKEKIGVRIEDNILISNKGPINLSRALSTGI